MGTINVGDELLCVVDRKYFTKYLIYKVILVLSKHISVIDDEGEEFSLSKQSYKDFIKVYKA